MFVRHPVWIQRVARPGAEAFAILFAIESLSRALLSSVVAIDAYRLLNHAQNVSLLFMCASIVGLGTTLVVPWLVRRTARRWIYSAGAVLLAVAPFVMTAGTLTTQVVGLVLRVIAVITMTICLNLYIMDYIARRDLSRSEPMRVFYSAGAWTLGPVLGVFLAERIAPWLPYAVSGCCALMLLLYFWLLRMMDSPASILSTNLTTTTRFPRIRR